MIGQYLRHCTERGGLFWEARKGICLGCPLSPVLGALFLYELDQRLEQLGVFYIRYLDDILVLAPTRWKLRRAVQVLNQTLQSLQLEKAPDKTFIGRIERGFDFLGYHLHQGRLSLAEKTVEKFAERAGRLYERERGNKQCFTPLGKYVRRWVVSQFDFLRSDPGFGPGFAGVGAAASTRSTIHSASCRVSVIPAAIAGVMRRVL